VQMNAPLVLWTIVGGYYRETLAYAVAYLSLEGQAYRVISQQEARRL